MPIAKLDRGIVKVSGDEAESFLQGLVTSDVTRATPARFAALLTPQGKILFDFFVVRHGNAFLLDVERSQVSDLAKRLLFYKLRAKVVVEDLSNQYDVLAGWGEAMPSQALAFEDPRTPLLGWRLITQVDSETPSADEHAYHAHRIRQGVPQNGLDFAGADTFPHEADMDQLAGVDFDKGCFVGQEVVSRMQHRSTVRTRAVPIRIMGQAEPEAEVRAGEKTVGRIGSQADGLGIAVVRLDRAEDALSTGVPLMAGDVRIELTKPSWGRFDVPGAGK